MQIADYELMDTTEPTELPLTQLITAAADDGLTGVAVLRRVTSDLTVRTKLFGQTVEMELHRRQEEPGDWPDAPSSHVATEMTALSRIFLDVLDGFVELRAPQAERLRLCHTVEYFLLTGSQWVKHYSRMLEKGGQGRSGETLTGDWHTLAAQLRARVRRAVTSTTR